ncbi:MAG: hypothetical protein EBX41_00715 [Chitinophagia bacterium]|nr:hypothetical protein [Chitinophagia bacterium]
MKLFIGLFMLFNVLFVPFAGAQWMPVAATNSPITTELGQKWKNYSLYQANEPVLNTQTASKDSFLVSLPLLDGSLAQYRAVKNNLIPAPLQQIFPTVMAYNLMGAHDGQYKGKAELTPEGIHAMLWLSVGDMAFIDPLPASGSRYLSYYTVHKKSDEVAGIHGLEGCQALQPNEAWVAKQTAGSAFCLTNGDSLRSYRFALSCNHQYALAATGLPAPSKAHAFAKMTTTMNRINGILERELAVTLQFVDREDTLIYVTATGDPFGADNSNANRLLVLNQQICDSLIGTANYDLGHIFSTGGGGLSQVANVCNRDLKAQSVTGSKTPTGDGFDIDYVIHEIGHEFGSNHTFNNNANGSCNGNAVPDYAFEPGGGSTIMCYAGICTTDNLQQHSDDYFSASSLKQIHAFLTHDGNACAVKSPTGNTPASVPAFSAAYYIPANTPFTLTAPATSHSASDTLITYCWEEHDLGNFGKTFRETDSTGPIFRSYAPNTLRTRNFPRNELLLSGKTSDAGCDNCQGEKLPSVARSINFTLTVRTVNHGYGCVLIPCDSVTVNSIATGEPFMVTSQQRASIQYLGGSTQAVTWNTAHTNDAPISTSQVDIWLSGDAGATYTIYLGKFPNTGSANVVLPDTTIA